MTVSRIRNFSIVAHIDHGKSTLADRLLERTGTVAERLMKKRILDSMEIERERGITIKLNAIRMLYEHDDGVRYQLNLIDTPGHVDFAYEVSRSLAACEGALLLVDATQGIEAQTIANSFLAMEAGLEIIPVINKIDLPAAEPERVAEEVSELLGIDADAVLYASAKEGEGIGKILRAIVERAPPAGGDPDAPLRALIFDSQYDRYRGVTPMLRVVDGELRRGMRISFGRHDAVYEVDEVGFMRLGFERADVLRCGEVGYLTAQIKNVGHTRVGDTILDANDRATEVLPGYRDAKPMVFAGLYPADSDQFEEMREAMAKLQLNDASLDYEPETSDALGFGFRCGFLGLLHMEIVQERLEREFGLNLITTLPNVEYHVTLTNGDVIQLENPSRMPDRGRIREVREPFVKIRAISPSDYIGPIQRVCHERRGRYIDMRYIDPERVEMVYSMPLSEIVLDFHDKIKSLSRGYASLDYDFLGYEPAELVKVEILINGDPVDALSVIVHKDRAYDFGRKMAGKLKRIIPRQLYDVAIQAAVGRDVIARTTVKALRKHVTAKCYGGDITRKRKLLERQKAGKRRMKQVGSVEIPQEAFLAVLQVE